jgi:hypothetical protein
MCGGKAMPPETMMTTTILPTSNEAWGFFGTMQLGGADRNELTDALGRQCFAFGNQR